MARKIFASAKSMLLRLTKVVNLCLQYILISEGIEHE